MPSPRESSITIRRIEGVNQAIDGAFLGPTFVRRLRNFVPDPALLLTRRPGTAAFQSLGGSTRCDALHRCYTTAGDRLLFAVQIRSPGVQLSTNDGAFANITNNTFSTNDLRYSIAELGDFLYIGNGTDPIKQIPIATTPTALDLSALGTFTDSSAAPTPSADAASTLLSGLYSYRWAVYNSSSKKWITSGQTQTGRLSTAGGSRLSFTSPAGGDYTLQANELFHLFVAPPDLPIEFAHDQSPEGVTQATALIIRDINIDSAPVPLRGAVRSGSMLVPHLGQIFFAGWATDPYRVFSTAPLTLGREQAIYDLGTFFPHNAASPRFRTPITGIAVATTTKGDNPRSPLLITTRGAVSLLYGRLYDDPSAELVEISSDANGIAHASMVRTTIGLIWCGSRTIWCLPPGAIEPVDIGWPIENVIRAIPRARRPFVVATFNKSFYKIALTPPSGSSNSEEWWLDLRRGLGSIPSWSGPHSGVSPTAYTVALDDSAEDDRCFVAYGTAPVALAHQKGVLTDAGTLTPALIDTGPRDDNTPFTRKIWTGVRANGRVKGATSLTCRFLADEGEPAQFEPLVFDASAGARWRISKWNASQWGRTRFQEGDAQAPESRPEGVSGSVVLTHTGSQSIDLRDIEIRYLPKVRPVAPERRGGN